MAESSATTMHGPGGDHDVPDGSKRDFLKLITGAGAAIGTAAFAWPLIDSMNPSADVLALASIEVELAPIVAGQGITVMWRGKPTFIRHRTAEEIAAAQAVPLKDLPDPQADAARVKAGNAQWLVLIGVCPHLGCIPGGNKSTEVRGEFGGWFCACHGSVYDTSGRIRKGPSPANLAVPTYEFLSPTKIKIG